MAYKIELTNEAKEHLRWLSARDNAIIRDAIPLHLLHEPAKQTRNRKQMQPNAFGYQFELRLGYIRVFYTVEDKLVTIVGVGVKDSTGLHIAGERIEL